MTARFKFASIGLLLSFSVIAEREAYSTNLVFGRSKRTLAVDYASHDVVVFAKRLKKGKEQTERETHFIVTDVSKGEDAVQIGQRISLRQGLRTYDDDYYILFGGFESEKLYWIPIAASVASYKFMLKSPSPSPKSPLEEQLIFYVDYLEHTDKYIAEDAFTAFAKPRSFVRSPGFPFSRFRPISTRLSQGKLLQWAFSKDQIPERRRLYGELLGLCGNATTTESMRNYILTDEYQLCPGMEGVVSGYLMLTGEPGLDLLEKKMLIEQTVFSRAHSLFMAVKFISQHASDRIPIPRLKQSLRLFLNNESYSKDNIVEELIRMEDWGALDQVAALYDKGKGEHTNSHTKGTIIRYLLVCSRRTTVKIKDQDSLTAEIVKNATEHLQRIRELDPEKVASVSKNFYPAK